MITMSGDKGLSKVLCCRRHGQLYSLCVHIIWRQLLPESLPCPASGLGTYTTCAELVLGCVGISLATQLDEQKNHSCFQRFWNSVVPHAAYAACTQSCEPVCPVLSQHCCVSHTDVHQGAV